MYLQVYGIQKFKSKIYIFKKKKKSVIEFLILFQCSDAVHILKFRFKKKKLIIIKYLYTNILVSVFTNSDTIINVFGLLNSALKFDHSKSACKIQCGEKKVYVFCFQFSFGMILFSWDFYPSFSSQYFSHCKLPPTS